MCLKNAFAMSSFRGKRVCLMKRGGQENMTSAMLLLFLALQP